MAASSLSGAAARRALGRKRALAGACVLVVAALAWRAWFSRSRAPEPPSAADSAAAEQRARARPNELQAQLDWGTALHRAGRPREAMFVFARSAQLAPRDPRPYVWLGLLAVQDHRPDVAAANLRQAVQCDPRDVDAWRALAEVAAQSRAYAEAIAASEQVVKLNPGDAGAWRRLGILATRTNRVAQGYEALRRAVALNPADTAAQSELGDNALYQGLLPEARQAFEEVLSRQPQNAHALAAVAQIQAHQDPSPEGLARAQAQVDRALALQPTAAARVTRGQIELLRKDYPAAIADLKAASAMEPDRPEAHVYLSQAYAAAGMAKEAREAGRQYQAALSRAQAQGTASPHRERGQ
jgi:tetratricopeptide (TPR) repeat protein